MQVMHRAGFSVTSLNIGSVQANTSLQENHDKKQNSQSKKPQAVVKGTPTRGTQKSTNAEVTKTKDSEKKGQRGRRQRRK